MQYGNRIEDKNHMIISIDTEKPLQNSISFYYKNSEEIRTIRKLPQYIKAIFDKSVVNIVINGEKLKSFPLKPQIR
jgi:hypothetical protein